MIARSIVAVLIAAVLCSACGQRLMSTTSLTFMGPGAEPDSLNPLLTEESDAADFMGLYAPVLLQDDDHDQLIPEIALAVPTRANGGISPDGLTITYHLRHGVVWQDGAPLTARDVVFTYDAIMNPANNVPSRAYYDQIASVTAKDPWTVVVRMKRVYSPIVAIFGNYTGYPLIPAHILAGYHDINHVPFNSLPIGAGPYTIVEWARGDHITLAANPRYWRGKPPIAHLFFKFIPDANTAASQLQTGELGAWFNADPNTHPELVGTNVRIVMHPMNDIHVLLLNVRDPILEDVRVRQAIAAAIDRQFLIRSAIHGLGVPIDGDQPTFSWAYSHPKDAIRYDPKRAAALLDEAGWHLGPDGVRYKDGAPLELSLSGTVDVTAWEILSAIIQAQLRRVGIVLTVKTYAPGLYFAQAPEGILRSGKYQIGYDARLLGADPDDNVYFGCDQFPPNGINDTFWCDRKADAAIKDALVTYDQARRAHDYAIVQEQLALDMPIIPLWQVTRMDAFSVPLQGFSPSPVGPTFWNAWQWRIDPRP